MKRSTQEAIEDKKYFLPKKHRQKIKLHKNNFGLMVAFLGSTAVKRKQIRKFLVFLLSLSFLSFDENKLMTTA